jgi:small subunit ribosomal protein S4
MKKTQLKAKHSRREGVALSDAASHVRAMAKRPYPPGVHGQGFARTTGYGQQLREKQKVKRMYGMAEKQFSNLFAEVTKKKGNSAQMFVEELESRLDNVVYRAGFAKTRAAARQAVTHAHFELNGRKMNIPSYRVKVGEVIKIRESKKSKGLWKSMEETMKTREVPSWLSVSGDTIKVTGRPTAEEINMQPFDAKMIVEFYSR